MVSCLEMSFLVILLSPISTSIYSDFRLFSSLMSPFSEEASLSARGENGKTSMEVAAFLGNR